MASIETIMHTINTAVPYHARDIIRPAEILSRRTASCFGRAALVGVALMEDGYPIDSLSLLISEAHGMPRGSGRHWFGHSELVVDTENEGTLVLTGRTVAFGDLDTTNWQRGVRPEDQGIITGVASLPTKRDDVDIYAFIGGIVDDRAVFEARDRYRAYPFEDGVARYQSAHPSLAEHPAVTIANYTALYAALPRASG